MAVDERLKRLRPIQPSPNTQHHVQGFMVGEPLSDFVANPNRDPVILTAWATETPRSEDGVFRPMRPCDPQQFVIEDALSLLNPVRERILYAEGWWLRWLWKDSVHGYSSTLLANI